MSDANRTGNRFSPVQVLICVHAFHKYAYRGAHDRSSPTSASLQQPAGSLSQLSVSALCVCVCLSLFSRPHLSLAHGQHKPVLYCTSSSYRYIAPSPWQREIKMRAVGRSPCGSNLPNWVVAGPQVDERTTILRVFVSFLPPVCHFVI